MHFCVTLKGLLWAISLTKYVEFMATNNSTALTAPDTYTALYSENMAEEVRYNAIFLKTMLYNF